MQTPNLKKDNLILLDSLRGLAAVYVLLSHARWLLWEGFSEGYKLHTGLYSVFDRVCMYALSVFSFGHQAVIFFFVLSGFVIHYSTSRKEMRMGSYLFKRARRLYPPLLLALLLTFLIDKAGMMNGYDIYHAATPYTSINQNIQADHSLLTLLGNLFFLQRIYTPVFGTNGPLWSLALEGWFYLMYIPLLWCYKRNKNICVISVVLLWIASRYYLESPILNSFPSWFAGMLLADIVINRSVKARHGLFLLFMSLSGNCDFMLAIAFFALIYLCLTTNVFCWLRCLHGLGNFSYTLYIIHFPILVFCSGWLMCGNGVLPLHSFYVLASLLLLPVAWVLHLLVEKPFTAKHN